LGWAQEEAGVTSDARTQASTVAGIASTGAIVKDLTPPIPAKVGVIAGTYGVTEAVRHSMGDPMAAVEAARYETRNYGDWAVRTIVADAAVRADYDGAGAVESSRPDPGAPDSSDDLKRWFTDAESAHYAEYWAKLNEGYNDQINTQRQPL
jgi:hypothetical protein